MAFERARLAARHRPLRNPLLCLQELRQYYQWLEQQTIMPSTVQPVTFTYGKPVMLTEELFGPLLKANPALRTWYLFDPAKFKQGQHLIRESSAQIFSEDTWLVGTKGEFILRRVLQLFNPGKKFEFSMAQCATAAPARRTAAASTASLTPSVTAAARAGTRSAAATSTQASLGSGSASTAAR